MKQKLLEYKGRSHFKNKVEGERRIKGEWGVQKEREVVGERVKRTPHLHSIQKDWKDINKIYSLELFSIQFIRKNR